MKINIRLPNLAQSITLVFFSMHVGAFGSNGIMYIPTPCEVEWERSGFIRPMPPEQIGRQEALAKMGYVDAQYFMGIAAQDKGERLAWLNKAIANGSKGAAAYYAYILDERWKTEPINPDEPDGPRKPISEPLLKELLQPVIDAAEAGEPQAATWLMEMGRGRWDYRAHGDHPILKLTDIPKWAEIAARGGNPAAAEWLCKAHDKELREFPGVEKKDDAQAFYWCSMAAPRTCSIGAKTSLAKLYLQGLGVAPSKTMSDYWSDRSKKSRAAVQIEGVFPIPVKNFK